MDDTRIKKEHIVVEIYESDATKGHTETNIIKAIRKVYETEDGKFFMEKPKGYFSLQEVDEDTFWNLKVNYHKELENLPKYEEETFD